VCVRRMTGLTGFFDIISTLSAKLHCTEIFERDVFWVRSKLVLENVSIVRRLVVCCPSSSRVIHNRISLSLSLSLSFSLFRCEF